MSEVSGGKLIDESLYDPRQGVLRFAALGEPCAHSCLHEAMNAHHRLLTFEIGMLDERHCRERHHGFRALLLVGDLPVDQVERNKLRREIGAECQKPLGRWTLGRHLLDGEAERHSDARRIARALGRACDPAVDALNIAGEARARELAKGAGVIESQRQESECLGEPRCAIKVLAHRPFLQEGCRRPGRKGLEPHLGCLAAPVGPACAQQQVCAADREQLADSIGRIDIVVDEQERGLCTPCDMGKRGTRGALLVRFRGELRVKASRQRGEACNQQCSLLRRRPPNSGIGFRASVGVFGDERGLADAA